jgi:7,8-didemethyl-8-hydroxy-5-deazariboflavin synthase CofG subunit
VSSLQTANHPRDKNTRKLQLFILLRFTVLGVFAAFASVPLIEIRWTVAMARLIFGPQMSLQAPPNLTPSGAPSWGALIASGINDWGGVSPVTRDFVNPEAPWPHLAQLAEVTQQAGFPLVPRLTIYPRYNLIYTYFFFKRST